MNILLSNDDGVHALGLNCLYQELKDKYQVTVIAPDQERSSCGHGLTLTKSLRAKQLSSHIYSCSGYPADCILVGLGAICRENRPDLVISGINHGANLGQDRFYSGTMAAAREASFRKIPAIAISLAQYKPEGAEKYFQQASKILYQLIDYGIHELIAPMSILNINIPSCDLENLAGFKITRPGWQIYSENVVMREDMRGENYFWVGGHYKGHANIEGSDAQAVSENYVSLDFQDLNGYHASFSKEDEQKLEQLLMRLK